MSAESRGKFQPLRDLPVALWLLALVVTLAHPWVHAPRWLMLHLLLLGALSHAIHVWSKHFTDTLLHAPSSAEDDRRHQHRLAVHNLGAVLIIAGVQSGWWPVTVVGAASVAAAAGGHAQWLHRRVRSALPGRFAVTVRYYVAAACLLPLGAALGAALATELPAPWDGRVRLAHVLVNVLGWAGLTVLGTLLTLWPTILRTRMAAGAEAVTRKVLPLAVGGVLVAAAGALVGQPLLLAAGLAAYLSGVLLLGRPMVTAACGKPPTSYAALSVGSAMVWLVLLLLALVAAPATGAGLAATMERLHALVPWLATGFAAQVLLGALSYLVPVALRGGPRPVRAATAALDRGSTLRVVAVNGGLVVLALPSPPAVRVLTSLVVLVSLAAFLPLMFLGMRASRRAKKGIDDVPSERPRGQLQGLAAVGFAAVVLAVAGGVAVDPGLARGDSATVSEVGPGFEP